MLHIIGIILKIIGIILAAILGILVLLICVVLFVPVRYTAEASFPGKTEEIQAKVKISWLLKLISFQLVYEKKELKWRLRAAWKKLGEEKSETKPEAKKEEPVKPETVKSETIKSEMIKSEPKKPEVVKEEPKKEVQTKPEIVKPEPVKLKTTDASESKKEPEEKEGFWEKIENKIAAFFEKIKYTFDRICAKIKEITEKKDRVLEFIENETHRSAFLKVKKEFVWIKRFLKPKRFLMNLRFGFEDPYYTGKVLAGLSMLYPFAGEYMTIEPEFEEQVLEGKVYIKGKLRFIHLAIMAGTVLLNRDVRTTYRDIKNFKI